MEVPNDARQRTAAAVSRRNTTGSDGPAETRLQTGFVVIVGLSSGLMALFGDGSVLVVGVAMLAGLVVGGCLLWYLRWIVG
ncbi:hypothetical protein HALLA_13000 [Halostagnicola larsenii XH-48]|uniref:Uncharacterized protein n=1 Tax=Halostagnicola larsenii XH-48 TaxID=797299 RepID=W0JLF1_9EURY|nr:hypothetical protein HALLA_13000 [Halostagnicola larsenii XH-48]